MRLFRYLAAFLYVLSIPAALVTTNIRFIVNEPRVYTYAIDQYDGVRSTGIDRDQLLNAGADLRRFFNDDETAPSIQVTQAGNLVPLFNDREVAHMADVKRRFRTMDDVQVLSIVYALAFIAAVVLWAREVTPRGLAVLSIAGSLVVLAGVGVIGAIGAAGFDSAWVRFHRIIFAGNDFWRLNPATDHLIQMFPPAFWQSIVFFIGLMIAAEAALLLVVAGLYYGASRHPATLGRVAPRLSQAREAT